MFFDINLLCLVNADFTIVSGKDGIHSENTDDTALGFIYIQSGTFDISAEGGTSSSSNGKITISGGAISATAYGDGIDANGSVEITGGNITVSGPAQGDTATLYYDVSATISGGTFIGTGASGMAQTFSDSNQGVISLSVGNQSAGTEITLKDGEGNTLITNTPELDFAVVILSSPDIIKGKTYAITVGSNSGEYTAD